MTSAPENSTRSELVRAADEVRAELVRVDSKINTLATVAGLLLTAATAVLAAGRVVRTAVVLLIWIGMAVLAGALLLLLRAIRPSLSRDPAAFTVFATLDETEILDAVNPVGFAVESLVDHLQLLSDLALTKYRWVRSAVDLLVTGTLILGGAVTLAVTL